MKYTILGFQQQKLVENNLNIEDAFILRTIKDMFSSASMEFKDFEGTKYMWINYSYLINQIPIIGSKRNLMRKIEKYGNELFLLRVLTKERKGVKGNFSYIAPTIKLDELQDYDLMTESHKGYDRNDIRVVTESHNKDTSIKDTSIKDNKDIYTDVYDYYISLGLIKHRGLNEAMKDAIKKAVKKNNYTVQDMKDLLFRHKEKIEDSKNTKWPVKVRKLDDFFGQKIQGATSLICTQYEEGGKYYKVNNKKEDEKKEETQVVPRKQELWIEEISN